MKTIVVKTAPAPDSLESKVQIGTNLLADLATICQLAQYTNLFILTDEKIAEAVLPLVNNLPKEPVIIRINAGEKEKTIDTVQYIWKKLQEHKCDRKSLLINLGGGVVGDMGGFVASTYMRGIPFIQVPTTLLAQVDASIGGKVAINFNGIKNLIGTFQQPKAVIIDTKTLDSLPDREFLSGFAEIIKHGLIADKEYFLQVTSKKPREFSQEELATIIARSVEIKQSIAENDPTEMGQRKLLNFGHTIGHAIESIAQNTNKPLLHGEAVSIGMAAEARLSEANGLLSSADTLLIKTSLEKAGLPVVYHIENKDLLLEKMQADKKNTGGKIMWTLLQQIGKGIYNQELSKEFIETEILNLTTESN